MSDKSIKHLCLAAMAAALVCISTLFFKVPIPLGYAHLGNGFILFGCCLLGGPYGIFIGGAGSALADLLGGFSEWILPTLLIKGVMGFVIGSIANPSKERFHLYSSRTFLASIAGIAVMVIGYFIGGSLLSGSLAAGIAQLPGLVSEGIAGIILFYIMGTAFSRVRIWNYI
ncbi:ECF transporter S component [Lachnospiraceae bacterium 62-35]